MHEEIDDLEKWIFGDAEDTVSRTAFIQLLWETYLDQKVLKEAEEAENRPQQMALSDLFQYGRRQGWLEEEDILQAQDAIEKRHAARILHQFLRIELGEADEEDISLASRLEDLYDCRVCVLHVAQMYLKGIMESEPILLAGEKESEVFGMRDMISDEKAKQMVRRLFEPGERKKIAMTIKRIGTKRGIRIDQDEAKKILEQDYRAFLVDVRSKLDYLRAHLPGAINLSMAQILEHPEEVYPDKSVPILLYCMQGIQSEMAADRLADSGYETVYYFSWKNL